jgi:hypothetical protein
VSFLPRLNRIQRMTLILFVIVVTNWAMTKFTGYSLIGGDLFTFFLIAFVFLLVVSLVWPWASKFFSKR